MKLVSFGSAIVLLSSLAAACGGSVETPSTGGSSTPTSNTGSGAPNGNAGTGGTTSVTGSGAAQSGTNLPLDEGWLPTAGGCRDFEVVALDQGQRRVLVIDGKKELLGLAAKGDTANVVLGPSTEEASVRVDVYDGLRGSSHYCTDDGPPTPKLTNSFRAISGNATFTISAVAKEGPLYSIDVTLTGVVVEHDNGGGTELIPDATFKDVKVGWFPG